MKLIYIIRGHDRGTLGRELPNYGKGARVGFLGAGYALFLDVGGSHTAAQFVKISTYDEGVNTLVYKATDDDITKIIFEV